MKKKELKEYAVSRDWAYVETMQEVLRNMPKKPRPVKPEGMSEADFQLSLQCASTRATLTRPPDQDKAHQNRPLPTNWMAVKDAKNMDEAVNARPVTVQEVALSEGIRRKGRNSQGDAVSQGASSVTPEKKEKARQAFNFSGGITADKLTSQEKQRVIAISGIEAPPALPAEEVEEPKESKETKASVWQRFKDLFTFKPHL